MPRSLEARLVGGVFGLLLWAWTATAQGGGDVWVFLRDKPDGSGGRIEWGPEPGKEALALPVDPAYLDFLEHHGGRVRVVSRWLNAVSLHLTADQLRTVESAAMVKAVQPVARLRAARPVARAPGPRLAPKAAQDAEFGRSFEQLAQVGLTRLHQAGYRGEGVRIAVLDNGFHLGGHEVFAEMNVVARRDFINGDDVVEDEDGQPVTGDESLSRQNIHGAQVLAVLGGNAAGQYVGAAPKAEFLLAKTENNGSELPVEEDLWVAGLEWADSLGARVINSSLGYNTFDDGSGYTQEDLDGRTAVTSRAAAAAVTRGMVLVVAAGNEGSLPWGRVTVPADAAGLISVGAVDRFRVVASTSSRGPTADGRVKPEVVAPGVDVWTAQVRGGGYARLDGTSFSAPLVSGVCALLLQMNPEWGPAEVLEALQGTATDLGPVGPDNEYGWGQVDAWRAAGFDRGEVAADRAQAPFPNPAAGAVFFPLSLTQRGAVELRVYDIGGGLVHVAEPRLFEAGDHRRPERALRWVPSGDLAAGVYFYELRAATFRTRGKIALVRGG